MDSLMASMMMLQRQQRTSSKQHVVTNVEKMKEDTKEVGENETCSSDRREFEEGIVTSADQVSIRTSENIKKDEGDSRSMRAESKIGKDGGTLDIQNTGVSLQIPPGALRFDYFVQMRIIPHHYLDETELSFASNSSVVVELLPNNVMLLKPATLTLPHCLVLEKKCGWKAKVYSSHHKEGNQPQWEEEQNAQCDVTYETCVMQFYNFSWKKVQIGDDKVEAKRIMLYAAMRSSIENEIFLDIGYYWQLPSCRDILNLNHAVVLHQRPAWFFRKGNLPLTVLFEEVVPTNWTYKEENNEKIINFITVAFIGGDFCTFLLKKGVSDETDGCTCYLKAGQGLDLVELNFSLKESSLSRAEAIILSTGNGIADSQEELPSAISRTKVRKKLLQKLSKKLTKRWREVGRNLKLTDDQLNILDLNYSDHQEKVYQMLLKWKSEKTIAATHGVLADALGNTGRVDLRDWVLGGSEPT
ncbi:uncharacterized protein [Apostichopus japonicus]|uniref:uncharacterized protein n=1 Tax=Stichopus japonicus TaxID=307972 RepID=UPI003AB89E97